MNNDSTSKQFIFDIAQNCASLHISEDIYVRILGKAVEQTKRDIVDLETAIPLDDFDKIRAIAHRLKGDYDNMRISSLSVIAKEMNEVAKTSKDKDVLIKLLAEFTGFFDQLTERIVKR